MYKKIVLISKLISFSVIPLFTWYFLQGLEHTTNQDYLYHNGLLGLFVDNSTIYYNTGGSVVSTTIIVGIVLLIKYIQLLPIIFSKNSYSGDIAKIISYTISNMITIFAWYLVINIGRDSLEIQGGLGYFFILIVVLLIIGWVVMLFMEGKADELDRGMFGIREQIEDYFYKLGTYENDKNRLSNNYKKITGD